MTVDLIFRIGAISIGLTGESGWEYTRVGRFFDFLSAETPQASFNVKISPVPLEPSGPLVFDSEQSWRLYQEGERWVLWARTYHHDPNLVGNFSADFHSGEIFISDSEREAGKFIFPISHPLGELLMINLLGTGYGIMSHSCGVIDSGSGIVFAGIGGAGKSTTARLWDGLPGVRVLNDDRTILRKIDGQFRVYGTPWHGQGGIALADDAPLKQIFILKQAPYNQALRLLPARAAADLLVRTNAPLWSAPAMAFTLQFLDELCQAVPCYELGFVPDQSAVEYVRCLSAA
jgi:hypothetical protein